MAEEEPINIWGGTYCNIPGGELCTACCSVLEIPELNKEAGTNCPHQEPCQGCKAIDLPIRPPRCGSYHCSKEMRPNVIYLLTGAALMNGEVSHSQMIDAQMRLLG